VNRETLLLDDLDVVADLPQEVVRITDLILAIFKIRADWQEVPKVSSARRRTWNEIEHLE
jgi:hypothetical protein